MTGSQVPQPSPYLRTTCIDLPRERDFLTGSTTPSEARKVTRDIRY